MLLHSDVYLTTSFCPYSLTMYAMLSREARNIYFIVFELTKPGIIIFLIGDKHTHYYFDKGIENSNLQ